MVTLSDRPHATRLDTTPTVTGSMRRVGVKATAAIALVIQITTDATTLARGVHMRPQQFAAGAPSLSAAEEEEEGRDKDDAAERERARRQLNTQPTQLATHNTASGRMCTTPHPVLFKRVRSKMASSCAADDESPPMSAPATPEARMDWNVMWAIVINVLMTTRAIQNEILNLLSPVWAGANTMGRAKRQRKHRKYNADGMVKRADAARSAPATSDVGRRVMLISLIAPAATEMKVGRLRRRGLDIGVSSVVFVCGF